MVACAVVACAAAAGCGYAPMASGAAVPRHVQSIYVETEEGARGDPQLADALERAVRRVVRRDGRFRLTSDAAAADAVLRLEVASTVTRPVAFDEFDDPLDYETTVAVDAKLSTRSGKVMWTAEDVGATRAHAAVAGAVVTSSSAFIASERLQPSDLAAFDTVQLGEERFAHAREALASDLAATVYLRMLEGR